MQYSWNAICNNGDRIFKGYWIYNGGVIFILPPLFKTNIFSKYKCLLPGSVPHAMALPWLVICYGMLEPFSNLLG